jgi:hypothetical protein
MSEISAAPGTLSAWRAALEGVDPWLSRQLTESSNPYAVLESLGLPSPAYVKFDTVTDFMDDPAAGIAQLVKQGVTNFYLGARPIRPGLHNIRNESKAEPVGNLVGFLEARIAPEHRDSYNLRIAEFLLGVAVVAIVDRDGTITLDIADGTLPPLTSGSSTPQFRASNDNPFGRLQYFEGTSDEPLPTTEDSLLNTAVRTAIWRALRYIRRQPGYYEFAIVDHHSQRAPVFADALLNDGTRNRAWSLPSVWTQR